MPRLIYEIFYFPAHLQPTCLGFMRSVRVAARFAALLASAQFPAVAVPKANTGNPGLMLPGIVSSASALQVQVQPFLGHSGSGIVLGAGAAAGGCAGCWATQRG